MKRIHFLIGFTILLVFDTLGQFGFKLTGNSVMPMEASWEFAHRLVTEPWALAILLAYGGAFVPYMSLIKDAPVGLLFAASPLEIVTVAALSMAVFGDRLTLVQGIGCAAIIVGILLLAKAEEKKAPEEA